MPLAIFDLDNTLIAGDSDYLWGEFLVQNQLIDAKEYQEQNQRFYQQYKEGTLDIYEYQAFSLKPLSEHPIEQLQSWHNEFMKIMIEPIMLPKAQAAIEQHKSKGDQLLIITATNSFITRPIGLKLGIDQLIGTEPEKVNGQYTGRVEGIPSFQQGKITRLNQWLNQNPVSLEGSFFYSDSHNDLPLLEIVAHPIAVDADETLSQVAQQRGWKQVSFR
ncbi:HAD family hydrolase [Thiomicrospira microaerophila]|uniref:histidinol-phosphatase n=1 Tax=Thiomicrospira microaerophila TaxID=406020 RepID=UPI00201026A3|nr:HAD family hydrolase [Thiomicrospira microaerophila]UQB41452.1 HAD family hydrolase [Thiomicrospira microaerophila]